MSKGEETKQFIIERATPVFNTRGVAATAMSDIMEATNLSKGSLYVHFENKELLSYAVVEYALHQFSEKVNAAINRRGTGKEKLLAFVEALSDPSHPVVKGGCPVMNFGLEADDTNPVIRQKVNRVMEQTIQTLASIVRQGIKTGEFNPGWDAEEFATAMFAMVEGGVLLSRIGGNTKKMKVITGVLKRMIEEQSI